VRKTNKHAVTARALQNISRSGPLRSYVRAPEGRVFVIADYSQIELRIAAKISGDQEMLSAYAEGRDLHTLTAQSLIGGEEISKDDRKLAKAVNFGLLYGMGAKGLRSYALRSYGVDMSLEKPPSTAGASSRPTPDSRGGTITRGEPGSVVKPRRGR
jgi:DNA polymerase I